MSNDNTTTLTGNLTREPELRFLPDGRPVCNFGIAQNTRRQVDGQWIDGETNYFDVAAFGSLGENLAESLKTGDRVIVHGSLRYRTWETDDGSKRSKIEVVADDVAASMMWATVDVTRNPRKADGTTSKRPAVQADYGTDEEPF